MGLMERLGIRTVGELARTPGPILDRVLGENLAKGLLQLSMGRDDRVVVMGEDVHKLNGGTNGATRGLKESYPDRVLGTPISENAFTGLGGGMALDGRYKPVVEFMYADFMWVAADQLFNQIGKARHMFGGDDPVPFHRPHLSPGVCTRYFGPSWMYARFSAGNGSTRFLLQPHLAKSATHM